jgi:hypothetical protein
MMLPRGIRNKNPGNIRISISQWMGKLRIADPEFEQFSEMKFGIRALMKLLIGYINRDFNTIEKIITRYAPGNENNTEAYIQAVCNYTGFQRDEVLKPDENTIKKMAYAISHHENGGDYLKIGDVEDAWRII